MKELWTEKYRPDTLDGYVFRDDAQKHQVEGWIASGMIPHLLFSGAPGVGETTLAKILINQLGISYLNHEHCVIRFLQRYLNVFPY